MVNALMSLTSGRNKMDQQFRSAGYDWRLYCGSFELAENLLAGTDNPLTYVAQHLCYQDLSAFSKAFKNHYGVSPTVWKQRHTLRD